MAYTPSLDPGLYVNANGVTDQRFMDLMAGQNRTPVGTDRRLPSVALVVGPSPFSMMRGWEFFITAPTEGVSYIATVLHNAGYPVRIIDVRYAVDPLGEAFRAIVGPKAMPAWLWVSLVCKTSSPVATVASLRELG